MRKPRRELKLSNMKNDLDQNQLLGYAQNLRDLMEQHVRVHQRYQNVLDLLQQGSLSSALLLDLEMHDPLTGLANLRCLEQRPTGATLNLPSDDTSVYVLCMVLDRFTPVNDELSHSVGDQVLQEVARRLQASVRLEDTVGRIGGNEFVVVLQKMKSQAVVERIIQSIVKSINHPINIGGHVLHLGISMGCAHHPCDGIEMSALIKHAKTAMYQAKLSTTGYAFYCAPGSPTPDSIAAADK